MKFIERAKTEKGSGGPTLYLRLKDGEAVNIIPRGEIHEFYSVFGVRGEAQENTPGAKLRFKMNVVINESGTLKAKLLEFGMTVYEQLSEINKVYGDVTKIKIRFSRKGSTKSDTVYMLFPLPNEPISPAIMKTIEGLKLNPLGPLGEKKPQSPPDSFDSFPPSGPDPDSSDFIPF